MRLFLDIDGVMVHANPYKKVEMEEDGFYKFNANAIDVINSIDDLEIILSTSHRFRFDIQEWENIFQRRNIKFKEISIMNLKLDSKFSRREEIEKWINDNKIDPDDLIIIDDDKSLNGLPDNLKRRLILTDPYIGLNNAALQNLQLRNR
ncbi:HAD domain-containing protein [Chryseobacterium sp. Chry.R1]|uniref:HAD domain-containing protein n=1 Tax=unclassified Chryseobacterium TaxID=2593645 RepID=UPI002359EC82|nr:HAD domain-containing protein [Chryseobacterium sp. B21-037]MDC8104519.1 HAD domain-containing protein [Chryseobacterium sp. B21-037]